MTERPGPTVRVGAKAVSDGGVRAKDDLVAAEEPMEIRVVLPGGHEHPVAVTMRTPGNDFELAVGFLTTEGVVRSRADLDTVRYCVDPNVEQLYNIVTVGLRSTAGFHPGRLQRNFYATSSCGVCGKASLEQLATIGAPPTPAGPMLEAAVLASLPDALRSEQRVFDRTGGLHAAGLFEPAGKAVFVREDVGRHNAVDKVVGAMVLGDDHPAGERVLVVSGRASFEIMQKAAMAGIPVIVAVGAPSSLAVRTAEEFGMTLAGFVTGPAFNIYAGESRIRLGSTPL